MNKPKIEILQKNVIYNKWASLIEYDIAYESDTMKAEMTRVVFDSGDGVAVLLYNQEEETIILVKQFRFGAYFNSPSESIVTEVVAGIVENDGPELSAKREVEEESGYRIPKVDYVGTVYATPGAHTEKLHLYTAEYRQSQKVSKGGGLETENEDIEVIEYHFSEIIRMYKNKEIIDAKTLILVQHWIMNIYDSKA